MTSYTDVGALWWSFYEGSGPGLECAWSCLLDLACRHGGVAMARNSKADINEQLADLHMGLALLLKEKLQEGTITSSELSVLRQFLKDNQISAQPVEGTPFGDLVSSLPDLDKVVHMPRRVA